MLGVKEKTNELSETERILLHMLFI